MSLFRTIQFIAPSLQDHIYLSAIYDIDDDGWGSHSPWDPYNIYGETVSDRTPVSIDITSGPVTIDFELDDSMRFNIDDSETYPAAIDGIWDGNNPDYGGAYIYTFDGSSNFLFTFTLPDSGYWETYRIWEWDNTTGFFIIQMIDSQDPDNSAMGKIFPREMGEPEWFRKRIYC